MKPSARVALIVALATTTAPTWASLPFYSPDYTLDQGFQDAYFGGGITPDGRAATTMEYYDDDYNYLIATWRGQTALPTPQRDSSHSKAIWRGMNREGWICGTTELTSVGHQPALWRPDSSRIDLPLLPASLNNIQGNNGYGIAYHVNDPGFVVGYSANYIGLGQFRPVYWTPSSEIVRLDNPLVSSNQFWEGSAVSISSTGIIAGKVSFGGHWRAMRWDINGTAPILSQTTDTGITYTMTETYESLDDGTILGWGSNNDGITHYGILWTPDGEAIDLRKLPASNSQFERGAWQVNNNYYSVGAARNSLGQRVAVRWSPTGEPLALDRLPDVPSDASDGAVDINDFNFAVGGSGNNGTYRHAILWTPDGDAIEFNSLIEYGDEWKSFSPYTITNTGWMSGTSLFDPVGPTEAYYRPFSILVPFAGTYGMGDANFDESIDFADLLIVAQNYGTSTNGSFDVGDFNLDGSVNFTDLLAIAQHYGDVFAFESDWQAARGMVPEPNLVGGLIGVGLMMRRRSR